MFGFAFIDIRLDILQIALAFAAALACLLLSRTRPGRFLWLFAYPAAPTVGRGGPQCCRPPGTLFLAGEAV